MLILADIKLTDNGSIFGMLGDRKIWIYDDWIATKDHSILWNEFIDMRDCSSDPNKLKHWTLTSPTKYFAIRVDGVFVGYVQAKKLDTYDQFEIGYNVIPRFWGKGYATQAVKLLKRLVYKLGAHRIYLRIDPDNEASRRVAEKCGFKYEGTFHHSCKIRGRWRDENIYADYKGRIK
jgi:RimJ/RimL family protein N-acetyltransferase